MPALASRVWVYRNGVKLIAGTDYTTALGSLTLTPTSVVPNDWTVAAGDRIEVQWVKLHLLFSPPVPEADLPAVLTASIIEEQKWLTSVTPYQDT
ncbi:MAG: hypothetical protein EOP51_33325 [Sphingobacteriales bacterium]|nr:MAG: hypothetical protein EOP51_33325 [Sphingobacteriales bacterium]